MHDQGCKVTKQLRVYLTVEELKFFAIVKSSERRSCCAQLSRLTKNLSI